jgi:hypothetical protein
MLPDDDIANSDVGSHEQEDSLTDVGAVPELVFSKSGKILPKGCPKLPEVTQ